MFSSLSFYGPRYIGTRDIAAVPSTQGLLSSLADTHHSNTVRRPSVSASVRNAPRCLSDFRTGGCPMAGRCLLHSTAGARRGQTYLTL